LFGLCLAAIGCSADPARPVTSTIPPDDDDDAGAERCIDRDHDGYGKYCSKGKDCDDDDADITDDCRRCLNRVIKDCPCERGTTAQRCTPPTIQVEGGILVCAEGNRYCRDGYWGDCETIGMYVFQKN
jgi:hypothetical protein